MSKVLREVGVKWRPGRGKYHRPNGEGYTDELSCAGLYDPCGYGAEASADPDRCREQDAVPALRDAIEATMLRLGTLRAMLALAQS